MKKRDPPPKNINQYVLSAQLGSGGFASVYKAFNKNNRTMYACKVFPKANLIDHTDEEHLQHEIDTMAIINHPGIVCLHDFFWDDKNFYMIMDLCKGGSLFDYVLEHDKIAEPLASNIFRQIVSAISYCHSHGVAHRDLKPENILIDKFPHVKVSDFGLCGFVQEDIKMQTFCGSTCYCAPECILKTAYDGRLADIWSLGCILYIIVSGDTPWSTKNTSLMIQQITSADYKMPDVSRPCQELIGSMLRLNPQERPSCAEILKHPWLATEEQEEEETAEEDQPEEQETRKVRAPLPPLSKSPRPSVHKRPTLMELAQSYKVSSEKEHGISSPFDNNISLGEGRSPSLPRLKINKLSPEMKKSDQENQKRLRFKPNNLSIGTSRQMSAQYLIKPLC